MIESRRMLGNYNNPPGVQQEDGKLGLETSTAASSTSKWWLFALVVIAGGATGIGFAIHHYRSSTPATTVAPTPAPTVVPTPAPTAPATPPAQTPAGCYNVPQLAQLWMTEAKNDAKMRSFCVPALAIAVGESWGGRCGKASDASANNGSHNGLWQISNQYFAPPISPKDQVSIVWTKYTSNNPLYGCTADWRKPYKAVPGIDQKVPSSQDPDPHIFCPQTWTGGGSYYANGVNAQEAGGLVAYRSACNDAANR